MGLLLLLIAFVPTPKPSAQTLMDFSRLAAAAGQHVVLVEADGIAREGILASATSDTVTMRFAAGDRVFSKASVASADRLRDGNKDGFIKGAIFGAVLGWVVYEAYGAVRVGGVAKVAATYGAIGWSIDALNKNREPIYRAPAALPGPAVRLSLRF